jgi:hypothetical protein
VTSPAASQRLPLQLLTTSDTACRVYLLVAYLDRDRGCFARLGKLAQLLDVAERTVSYGLNTAGHWLVRDEAGNLRATRPIADWIGVPYRAFTELGTGIRCYAAIRHLNRLRTYPTHRALAALLGCTPRTIVRQLEALEASGWITRERRAGYRGANTIVALDLPDSTHRLEPAAAPDEPSSPDDPAHGPGDRSCAGTGDSPRDVTSDSACGHISERSMSEKTKPDSVPAAGGTPSGTKGRPGTARARERARPEQAEPRAEPPARSPRRPGNAWAGSGRSAFVARIWSVLGPVIAEEIPSHGQHRVNERIVAQMPTRTAGQLVERIQRRARRRPLDQPARDPVALAMWLVAEPACPDPRCEDGTHLDTGRRCVRCVERAAERGQEHREKPLPAQKTGGQPEQPGAGGGPAAWRRWEPPAPGPRGYADDHADELAAARAAMAAATAGRQGRRRPDLARHRHGSG